jgi:hypothetical protein
VGGVKSESAQRAQESIEEGFMVGQVAEQGSCDATLE